MNAVTVPAQVPEPVGAWLSEEKLVIILEKTINIYYFVSIKINFPRGDEDEVYQRLK